MSRNRAGVAWVRGWCVHGSIVSQYMEVQTAGRAASRPPGAQPVDGVGLADDVSHLRVHVKQIGVVDGGRGVTTGGAHNLE